MPSEITPEDLQRIREEDQEELDEEVQREAMKHKNDSESQSPAESTTPEPTKSVFTEKGVRAMQGPEVTYVPLPDHLKEEIFRIQSLPAEQRQRAMGEFFSSLESPLDNTTEDQKILQLNTEILPGGKGVVIHDSDGNKYRIDYE